MNIITFKYDEDVEIDEFILNQSNLSESIRTLIKNYIINNGATEVIEDRTYTTNEYYEMIKEYMNSDREFTSKEINNFLITKLSENLNRELNDDENRLEKSKIRRAIADLRKDGFIEVTERGIYKVIL